MFHQSKGDDEFFDEKGSIPLEEKPLDVAISAKGICMVRYPSEIQLYSPSARTPIKFERKDFMGFEFSADGEYFALWESDNPSSVAGTRSNHSWTVWKADKPFQKMGETINHEHEVRIDLNCKMSAN